MRNTLSPVRLQLILGIMLFVMLGLGVGVAVVAKSQLSSVADQTSASLASAEASQGNLQALQTIEKKLQQQEPSVKRAQDIVGLSQGYTYQDQVVRDLNTYAGRSGIAIKDISFASSGSPASPAPASSGIAAPSTSTTPNASTATPSVRVIKSNTISITLAGKATYEKLLTFYSMIEQSLPKLQILSVSLTRPSDGSGGIDSQALQIDVYIR